MRRAKPSPHAKILKFLALRPRSVAEVKARLNKYCQTKNEVSQILTSLQETGLVNDFIFAERWVTSRLSKRSSYALRQELKQKGVSDEIINKVLRDAKRFDLISLRAIVLKKISGNYTRLHTDSSKLYRYLLSKGYSSNQIKTIFVELISSC